MSTDNQELIPVFVPSLSAILVNAEDKKDTPLNHDEVTRIRDGASCIMMSLTHARQMAESRGYEDIDPENCWYQWQMLRRELGRKPDIDPGPSFAQVNSSDPEYQETVARAHATIDSFRAMLPSDGAPRFEAMVKTEVINGDNRAFLWLANTRVRGEAFVAEIFEVPATFGNCAVGEEFEIHLDELLDWMMNDNGILHGGFSLRYHRSHLAATERTAFDEHIGVTGYA